MRILDTARQWARRVKRDVATLWFARTHPDTPWHAKALAVLAVGYALSPIDLIPDVIPVLGLLDDIVLLPALIWLAVRLLPAHVLSQARASAEAWLATSTGRPRSWRAAAVIVVLWLALAGAAAAWLFGLPGPSA